MTYGELSYRAKKLYTKGKITICEYLEMTKPLDREIEQEPILNKIRTEIMDTGAYEQEVNGKTEFLKGINYCLSVIDKYKAESENEK